VVADPPAIQVLAPDLVARIAAGEVITRPRAAVRELVDNALDAGATRIEVEIESGGYNLIAVHDDGIGISSADASLIFTRHATSKLRALDGLASICTLGFRGEALASLASVADVEIRTRGVGEVIGARIVSTHGDCAVTPLVRQAGTSIEARRLFSRYPVRRGAAEPASEARAIRRVITHLALVRPEVGFTLRTDGRLTLISTGGTLRDAFAEVVGSDALPHLLDIDCLPCESVRVRGVSSGPAVHRSSREGIVLAINGRLCDVPEIRKGIERAYVDILPRQRFPHAILSLDIPPAQVDVNVHPAKERVIVHGGREIAQGLERELRTTLGKTTHLVTAKRSLALRAADLPGLRAGEQGDAYDASGWGGRVVAAGSLPELRVVGQIEDTLIVCETDLGTLLIDQHRAHERVIFERLLSDQSIMLPDAVLLAIPARVWATLDARSDDLRGAGWQWSEFGADQILVSACPDGLAPDDLIPIAERFAAETAHSILAAAACHAAIRKRRPLTPETALALLRHLTQTSTPTTCPHGQPIVINLSHSFLEQQFGWR
jgi:DNA mismatch repair protein MutL